MSTKSRTEDDLESWLAPAGARTRARRGQPKEEKVKGGRQKKKRGNKRVLQKGEKSHIWTCPVCDDNLEVKKWWTISNHLRQKHPVETEQKMKEARSKVKKMLGWGMREEVQEFECTDKVPREQRSWTCPWCATEEKTVGLPGHISKWEKEVSQRKHPAKCVPKKTLLETYWKV
jgi:hypothetical protein